MARRLLFGAATGLALWVAAWGLLAPSQIERAVPWALPPLHARFVGALYLSGAVCMLGMLVGRRWSRLDVIAPMIAIWTGVLLGVMLWRRDDIGPTWSTVVVWFVAYTALPITESVRVWRHRADRAPGPGPAIASWLRWLLVVQGIVVTILATLMVFAPGLVAAAWPWTAPELAVQIYGGPLLAYGVGSLLASRRLALDDLAIVAPAFAVFAGAVLVVSVAHLGAFHDGPAGWIWFVAFGAAAVLYGWLTTRIHVPRGVLA